MLSSITKKGEIESTSAPLVVLLINVNISPVGLMYYLEYFRQVQQMEWQGQEDVEPLQGAKDKGLAQAQKLKTLHFTFSDPRSH